MVAAAMKLSNVRSNPASLSFDVNECCIPANVNAHGTPVRVIIIVMSLMCLRDTEAELATITSTNSSSMAFVHASIPYNA
jgi:hypothetical protein